MDNKSAYRSSLYPMVNVGPSKVQGPMRHTAIIVPDPTLTQGGHGGRNSGQKCPQKGQNQAKWGKNGSKTAINEQ